jgi:sortase A
MARTTRAAGERIPKKSWTWMVICVIIAALVVGMGGGYALVRFGPLGRQLAGQAVAPTAHAATSTPTGGTNPGSAPRPTVATFQQFASAISSYQAQPMDAQTGLRLIIPSIHVNAPIVERGVVQGWMVVAPGQVVTHFIYSAYPGALGNAILYSHAGTVFRHLDSLAVGDTLIVQTPQGVAHFRVRELRIVAPTDLSVLNATPTATLTLLTCYPYMVDSSRLVVIADLVSP